jgi:diadenylate cyclase
VSRALGTRHRAAVGITEETDAVVLVVSEETGRLSLVRRGKLTSYASAGELLNDLQVFLASQD